MTHDLAAPCLTMRARALALAARAERRLSLGDITEWRRLLDLASRLVRQAQIQERNRRAQARDRPRAMPVAADAPRVRRELVH